MDRFINEKIRYKGETIIKCNLSSIWINCIGCFLYDKLKCYYSISYKSQIFGKCEFKTIYKKIENY